MYIVHALVRFHFHIREARSFRNGWIFGKFPKGGGDGAISDLKNFIAIFFALETAILVMNFRKKIEKGGGHFRSEKFHCKFSAGETGLRRKSQYFYPKKGRGRGGGQRPFRNFPEIHPFWQRRANNLWYNLNLKCLHKSIFALITSCMVADASEEMLECNGDELWTLWLGDTCRSQ